MLKKKYEKPVSRNLSSVDVARGSCWSGNIEYKLIGCVPGAQAVDPCTTGSTIYPRTVCSNGSFAGASCFSGSDAG